MPAAKDGDTNGQYQPAVHCVACGLGPVRHRPADSAELRRQQRQLLAHALPFAVLVQAVDRVCGSQCGAAGSHPGQGTVRVAAGVLSQIH